jgi:hypothetical protein
MKAIDPRMPTATELAFVLNVGAARHSVSRWPALRHCLAIARARGEHRLTQPTCLPVIAALRGRGRQISHGDVARRIFQQAQPRCARCARGSRARPRAPAGWVPFDSRTSGTNWHFLIDDRPAMASRGMKPVPFRPGRREWKGPRFIVTSVASVTRRLNLPSSNDLRRRRKTPLCDTAAARLRHDRVSTCRLCRSSGSIRSGETAIEHRVLENVLLGAIRLTISLILRDRRRWKLAATCPSPPGNSFIVFRSARLGSRLD